MVVIEVRTLKGDTPSQECTLQIFECLACADTADAPPSQEAVA
jgi:hypothetical protein